MTTFGPMVRLVLLLGVWVVWAMALLALRKVRLEKPVQVNPRARWGIFLEMTGYALMCCHGPEQWASDMEAWRAIAGAVTALISIFIFWSAVASLGKQWRFDAGLNKEHELVQSGAYRIVRHPIYASMFGMLIAAGFLTGTMPGWPIAIVLFIAGTEIRVRVEDGLLRDRFGQRFIEWQKKKAAYLPFVR